MRWHEYSEVTFLTTRNALPNEHVLFSLGVDHTLRDEGDLQQYHPFIVGASLSEPHTSVTALLDTCVCMFVRGHIPKI